MFSVISASLSINIATISANLTDLLPAHLLVCVCVGWSVCLSVCLKVFCGKRADWIQISFGMVSGVYQGMGLLDGIHVRQGKGQFWGSVAVII